MQDNRGPPGSGQDYPSADHPCGKAACPWHVSTGGIRGECRSTEHYRRDRMMSLCHRQSIVGTPSQRRNREMLNGGML